MKKNIVLIISLLVVLVIIVLGLVLVFSGPDDEGARVNPYDGTYNIGGENITLKNGVSEIPAAPGSASKITTRYFGNSVKGDFDGDGTGDVAFLVTQDTGGSGTFYYVTALLNTKNGKVGVPAILLGDRIAPQSTSLENGNIIVVNYAERKAGESFAVQPSLGKTLKLKVNAKTLKFDIIN